MPVVHALVIRHYTVENPVPVMVALVIAALILLAVAWQDRRRRPAIAAAVVLAVAAALWLVATVVETRRETLMRHTRYLLDATAPLDEDGLRRIFSPDTVVTGPDGKVWYSFDETLAELRGVLSRFRIRGHRVDQISATAEGADRGSSHVRISTRLDPEQYPTPIHTAWRLSWRRDPDVTWRLIEIRWLEFEGNEPMMGMWP